MEQLILQLKRILATSFAMYLKSHNYHWNVEGPDFPEYHEFLGNLYEEVYGSVDTTAEKIRMLGAYSPTGLDRMLELCDIQDNENIPSAIGMFAQLKSDNDRFIIHLRAGIVLADQAGEPAISNFLQDILDQHQKQAWFLSSLIK